MGGGSPIDAAKAILFFSAKQRDVRDVLFAAIPTTSGTGSEVSRFAVITDREKEVKYPLVDDGLLPHAAVLDPVLTVSVPPAVTADTGIDVFTHAVEAFVSTAHTDFSDAAAEKALKLAYRNLLEAYRDPENLEARQKMHNASCLAGIAFSNSGLGLNHGMAHALGAHFHISHGRANGILLPYVMSFNAGCIDGLTPTAKRYAQISRLLRLDSSSVRQSALQLIRTIRNSMDKLGMPSTIKDAGVPQAEFEADVEAMAADALALHRHQPQGVQPGGYRADLPAGLFGEAVLIAGACIRGWLAVNTGSFRCGWGAEGRRGIDIWAGMGYFNRAGCDGQRYRSGHNGAGSKSARRVPPVKSASPRGTRLSGQETAGKFSKMLTVCSQFSNLRFHS